MKRLGVVPLRHSPAGTGSAIPASLGPRSRPSLSRCVVNQLILFAAALAATATTGRVIDLAAGPTHDTPAAVGGVQESGSAETITESGGGSARR